MSTAVQRQTGIPPRSTNVLTGALCFVVNTGGFKLFLQCQSEFKCGTTTNVSSVLTSEETPAMEVILLLFDSLSILYHLALNKSGILPPALVQESRVPQFYRDAIAECGAENITKLPDTNGKHI